MASQGVEGSVPSGAWDVLTEDASVRLRGGRVGPVTVDVTAPVAGGALTVGPEGAGFTLQLALDGLRTGNFLMQAAARSLVGRHDARVLTFEGVGPEAPVPWWVAGHALAGTIDVVLQLTVTPSGPSSDPMAQIELVGNAQLGTVNLPLPGLGTVEDFAFDVEARLALRPRSESAAHTGRDDLAPRE
jgi:hypothetical protein